MKAPCNIQIDLTNLVESLDYKSITSLSNILSNNKEGKRAMKKALDYEHDLTPINQASYASDESGLKFSAVRIPCQGEDCEQCFEAESDIPHPLHYFLGESRLTEGWCDLEVLCSDCKRKAIRLDQAV